MKTLRTAPFALLALVLSLAVIGSSCSAANPVALQVGEWQLSASDFQTQLNDYADAVVAAGGSKAQFEGPTSGSWATTFTSQLLSYHLEFQLAQLAVAQRGLTVTSDDLATTRSNLEKSATNSASVFAALPADLQDEFVSGFAAVQVLGGELLKTATTDEALRLVYDTSGDTYTQPQACVSHILIFAGQPNGTDIPSDADYATALTKINAVQSQLKGTDNFAALATANSEDTGSNTNGGDLGCAPQGTYVQEFDDAAWAQPVGVVSQPVKTNFGYHLILVRSRGVLSFEDVKAQIAAQVTANPDALVQAELAQVAKSTTVTVDGRFGRFDETTGQITVPAGAEQPSTTIGLDPLAGLTTQ